MNMKNKEKKESNWTSRNEKNIILESFLSPLDALNRTLDTEEEKSQKFKDIGIETIQKEAQRMKSELELPEPSNLQDNIDQVRLRF
jgi:molecular chaperone GrpE (heat shock protein)